MLSQRQTAEAPWQPEDSAWQGLLVLASKNGDPLSSDDAEVLGGMIVSKTTPAVWDVRVTPDNVTDNVHVSFSAQGPTADRVLDAVLEPVFCGVRDAELILGGFKTQRALIVDAMTFAERGDRILSDPRCDMTERAIKKIELLGKLYKLGL